MQASKYRLDTTEIPVDVWTQFALSLAVVKSKTPWRDVNSLTSTCKHLFKWKKSDLTNRLLQERNHAMNILRTQGDPHTVLQKILDVPADSVSRLLREPVLRVLFDRRQADPVRLKVLNQSPDFLLTLYAHRESASLSEIKHCFKALDVIQDDKGLDLCHVLLSLLTTLKGDDRLKGIRLMFDWIDKQHPAGEVIWTDKTFSNIHAALGEDDASKASLELGLHARKLLPYTLNLHDAAFSLSWLSDDRRWDWVAANVPEFIETRLGIVVLLSDPMCAPQLISEFKTYFSEEKVNTKKLLQCARVLMLHQQFEKQPNGKKLIKQVCRCLIQTPEGIGAGDSKLYRCYKASVKQFIAMETNYLKIGERDFLYRHLFLAAGEAMASGKSVRFTEMLQLAARGHRQSKLTLKYAIPYDFMDSAKIIDTLRQALSKIIQLSSRDDQLYYVHMLLEIAKSARHLNASSYKQFKAEVLAVRKTIT